MVCGTVLYNEETTNSDKNVRLKLDKLDIQKVCGMRKAKKTQWPQLDLFDDTTLQAILQKDKEQLDRLLKETVDRDRPALAAVMAMAEKDKEQLDLLLNEMN